MQKPKLIEQLRESDPVITTAFIARVVRSHLYPVFVHHQQEISFDKAMSEITK